MTKTMDLTHSHTLSHPVSGALLSDAIQQVNIPRRPFRPRLVHDHRATRPPPSRAGSGHLNGHMMSYDTIIGTHMTI